MVSGRREQDDEKIFATNLSKAVHVSKANIAQRQVIRKANKARTASPAAESAAPKPRSAKKSSRGTSIWISLKGSFASAAVEGQEQNRRAAFRARLTEKRRVSAAQQAKDYIDSAKDQAKEAGLLDTSSVAQSDEAVSYLEQQYDVAAGMLKRPAVGSHVASLIAAVSTAPVTTPLKDSSAFVAGCEEAAVTEATLLQRAYTVAEGVQPADAAETLSVNERAQQLLQQSCCVLREPMEDVSSNNGPTVDGAVTQDVVPTKCIMKLRSGAGKSTCIVSNQKSVAAFRQSLSLFLKKEVAPFLRDSLQEGGSPSSKKKAPVKGSPKKADADSAKKRQK